MCYRFGKLRAKVPYNFNDFRVSKGIPFDTHDKERIMLKRRFLAVLLTFVLLVGLVPEYTSASKPYASEPSDEPGVSELSDTIISI